MIDPDRTVLGVVTTLDAGSLSLPRRPAEARQTSGWTYVSCARFSTIMACLYHSSGSLNFGPACWRQP